LEEGELVGRAVVGLEDLDDIAAPRLDLLGRALGSLGQSVLADIAGGLERGIEGRDGVGRGSRVERGDAHAAGRERLARDDVRRVAHCAVSFVESEPARRRRGRSGFSGVDGAGTSSGTQPAAMCAATRSGATSSTTGGWMWGWRSFTGGLPWSGAEQ